MKVTSEFYLLSTIFGQFPHGELDRVSNSTIKYALFSAGFDRGVAKLTPPKGENFFLVKTRNKLF